MIKPVSTPVLGAFFSLQVNVLYVLTLRDRAQFVCDADSDSETYVDDEFSNDELRLICGTYTLGDTHNKGGMSTPIGTTKLLLLTRPP
jgi:hypothetical protein